MSTMATINPVEPFLRMDRMPHIWCPGCGIGTTVNCFARALVESKLPLDNVAMVSGIGCTGRVAGYMNLDSFHTTHGRAIPFATGLKLANPKLHVVVYSGDGDLIAIGGNHFIHAARRNVDIKVICVNNFIYGMTGGQVAPTTPLGATATTAPYGCLRAALQPALSGGILGAVYVARWTAFHVRHIAHSMVEAFKKKGFSFIEISRPAPRSTSGATSWATGLTPCASTSNAASSRTARARATSISVCRATSSSASSWISSGPPCSKAWNNNSGRRSKTATPAGEEADGELRKSASRVSAGRA